MRQPLFLALATVACLAPFLDKAFHIDDPVYVRTAQQIVNHPLDPYGFDMNWYGTAMPVHEFNQNPPGVSYYLAVAGWLFGWSERALHAAMLIPAMAVSLGIYTLARRFTNRPVTAALAAFFTPALMVSSTNVMTDVLLLGCYVWAIAAWVHGIQKRNHAWLLLSGVCMAAAFFTKYFGVTLIPLLLVYALAHDKRPGLWVGYFLVPLGAVAAYQWYSAELYGRPLFTAATSYATEHGSAGASQSTIAMIFTALCFVGGCFASALCFTPWLWRWSALVGGLVLAAVCTLIPLTADTFIPPDLEGYVQLSPLSIILAGVFIASGLQLVVLAIHELRRRDAAALLLFLWLAGTLVFAAFINWTVNARSLLPLAPVIGILVARRLDQCDVRGFAAHARSAVSLLAAAGVALWVAVGDYQFTNASRSGAKDLAALQEEGPLYFQGHWGFQYYMEELGVPPLDFIHTQLQLGDFVVIPTNNTNVRYFNPSEVTPYDVVSYPVPAGVATVNLPLGAGFYSHAYGPLPYVFGKIPPQEFRVYRIGTPDMLKEEEEEEEAPAGSTAKPNEGNGGES